MPTFVRANLHFFAADRGPRLEWLNSRANSEQKAVAASYFGDFRLPCLAEGGTADVVVELGAGGSAEVLTALFAVKNPALEKCRTLQTPGPLDDPRIRVGLSIAYLLNLTFSGGPNDPPNVRVALAVNSTPEIEEIIKTHAAGYRAKCRAASDLPSTFELPYRIISTDVQRYVLTKKSVTLSEFLAMARDPSRLQRSFELNTMNCPFKLNLKLGLPPELPNRVTEAGGANPNRAIFKGWLRGIALRTNGDRQRAELVHESMTVTVPCGTLDPDLTFTPTQGASS